MRPKSGSITIGLLTAALAACSSPPNGIEPLPSAQRSDAFARAPMVGRPASSETLYISDFGTNSVTLFPANVASPPPIATISDGVNKPQGIAVDRTGMLYVANSANQLGGGTTVTEYPTGSNKPSITIDTPYVPFSIAVDAKGNVYVGGKTNKTIEIAEYARGGTTPIRTVFPTSLAGDPFMGGLGFDSRGNLYAAFFVYDDPPAHVFKFAAGLKRGRDLHLSGLDTTDLSAGLGLDGNDNLYVGGTQNGINVYPPGSKTPSRSISGGFSQFFAVGKDGSLYDPTQLGGVLEFAPGASNPDITFKGSLEFPEGAAIH